MNWFHIQIHSEKAAMEATMKRNHVQFQIVLNFIGFNHLGQDDIAYTSAEWCVFFSSSLYQPLILMTIHKSDLSQHLPAYRYLFTRCVIFFSQFSNANSIKMFASKPSSQLNRTYAHHYSIVWGRALRMLNEKKGPNIRSVYWHPFFVMDCSVVIVHKTTEIICLACENCVSTGPAEQLDGIKYIPSPNIFRVHISLRQT